jgi:hypothetical protein
MIQKSFVMFLFFVFSKCRKIEGNEIMYMIRLHVSKPECSRKDLSYVELGFSYVW